MHKSHIYQYEREIRAVICDVEHKENELGKFIQVNLETLVQQIIIHPKMDKTVLDNLEHFLKNRPLINKLRVSTAYNNPGELI